MLANSYDELVRKLMNGCSGVFIHEAAIRLVERHGYWLHHKPFVKYIVDEDSEGAAIDFEAAAAALDRGDLGIDADDEAKAILRFAASISGWYPICLRDCVDGMIDRHTIGHMAEAIMYADGYLASTADPLART